MVREKRSFSNQSGDNHAPFHTHTAVERSMISSRNDSVGMSYISTIFSSFSKGIWANLIPNETGHETYSDNNCHTHIYNNKNFLSSEDFFRTEISSFSYRFSFCYFLPSLLNNRQEGRADALDTNLILKPMNIARLFLLTLIIISFVTYLFPKIELFGFVRKRGPFCE